MRKTPAVHMQLAALSEGLLEVVKWTWWQRGRCTKNLLVIGLVCLQTLTNDVLSFTETGKTVTKVETENVHLQSDSVAMVTLKNTHFWSRSFYFVGVRSVSAACVTLFTASTALSEELVGVRRLVSVFHTI